MNNLELLAYLAHSKSKSFLRKLDNTIDFIIKHNDLCCSVSWGKDSVVMVHLVAQHLDSPKAINARYPCEFERLKDMDVVRDKVLNRKDMKKLKYLEVDTPGEWEMFERAGHAFADASTKEEKESTKWWKDNFVKNMHNAAISIGCSGHFIGMCVEESRGRKLNVKKRGRFYIKKDGTPIGLPLAYWSSKDIWAYHVANKLPCLRIYEVSPRGRHLARSGFVFATSGGEDWIHSQGIWKEWEMAYPYEFNGWLDKFPEMRKIML